MISRAGLECDEVVDSWISEKAILLLRFALELRELTLLALECRG